MSRLRKPIEDAVCKTFGLTNDELWSKRSSSLHVLARGAFVHVLTSTYPLSVVDIENMVGRGRSTLYHAQNRFRDRLPNSIGMQRSVREIAGMLNIDPEYLLNPALYGEAA